MKPRPPARAGSTNHRRAPRQGSHRERRASRFADRRPASPAAIGMGQVVDRFAKPKEHGFPRVVEFRHVTKTYNAGLPNQYTAISDVSFFVEDIARQGRVRLHPRAQRLRQEHDPAADRRLCRPSIRPAAGEVLVQGSPVAGPGADRGMVFQDYTSFDHRSVLENITFGLECQGRPPCGPRPARPRVDRARGPERRRRTPTSTRTSFPAACCSGWRSPAR